MKRPQLTALALIGINVGLLLSSFTTSNPDFLPPEMRAFYNTLNPEAQKQFLELDTDHKWAAMSSNSHGCNASQGCGAESKEEAVQQQYNDQMQHSQE